MIAINPGSKFEESASSCQKQTTTPQNVWDVITTFNITILCYRFISITIMLLFLNNIFLNNYY